MQKVFDHVSRGLLEFVDQRDDLLLVVRCRDQDCAIVLKLLSTLEERETPDLFFPFANPFESPARFADAVTEQMVTRIKLLNEQLEKEGQPERPPVPPVAQNPHEDPLVRMRALMLYARDLLPDPVDGHLIWALFPTRIDDPIAWARFVVDLSAHEVPIPWCHHMRILAREDSLRPGLDDVSLARERVRRLDCDFRHETLVAALEEEVENPEVPLPRRLEGLLQLAALDYAMRRYDEAIEKYELVAEYFGPRNVPTMLAAALNGIAEVHARRDEGDRAVKKFQEAAEVAMAAGAHPLLLTITLNLGELMFRANLWEEAAQYFQSGAVLATALLSARARIQCHFRLGQCRAQQERWEASITAYRAAADLARGIGERDALREVLESLERVYQTLYMDREREDVRAELHQLAYAPPDPPPHPHATPPTGGPQA